MIIKSVSFLEIGKIFCKRIPCFLLEGREYACLQGLLPAAFRKKTQGLKGGSTPEKQGWDRLWGFLSFMACKAFSGIYREDYYRIALNFSKRLSDVLYRQKTDCGKNMRETRL